MNINAAHMDIDQNLDTQIITELKECHEEERRDGGKNRRRIWMDECARGVGGFRDERRKCSEVDQPRVKQDFGRQVMHAADGVYRERRWLLMRTYFAWTPCESG